MAKRGKTPIFADGRGKAEALKLIKEGRGAELSYYHRNQLIQMGLMVKEDGDRHEGITKGRRPKIFNLTRKGYSLLNLSKNWKKA